MRLMARPSRPLTGKARAPGDKSMSHRSLILGALAEGVTEIDGLLEGADVLNTAAAMTAFGAGVERTGPGRWRVVGRGPSGFIQPTAPIDFGNSGTGARLTMGAAARFPITVTFTGDESLSARPMNRVLTPLKAMGITAGTRDGGRLPVTIHGTSDLSPITYPSPVASAQVKSAILLAGLGASGTTTVVEQKQTRDHTERMLAAFGVTVATEVTAQSAYAISLTGPARLTASSVHIPADPSSAAFATVAASILHKSDIRLDGVCLNPLRTGLYTTLQEMGADLQIENRRESAGEVVGDLIVRGAPLKAVSPPASRAPDMIDEIPILAIAAAFAEGESRLTGAEELRVKESDRIALTVAGLRACGIDADELPDGLVVFGRGAGAVRGGATIETHGDHRIAMAFLVLGLGAQNAVTVLDADMIATSFPNFAGFMGALGADITEPTP
ncbi:MAG: 3-phosphoshikimate 1-carboxyvinyltransferase [Caulobacterales bacterium]